MMSAHTEMADHFHNTDGETVYHALREAGSGDIEVIRVGRTPGHNGCQVWEEHIAFYPPTKKGGDAAFGFIRNANTA